MGKLAVLMATAFVDMIGAVMILPLLPFYAETMGVLDRAASERAALGKAV
jgi:hypothetical protein